MQKKVHYTLYDFVENWNRQHRITIYLPSGKKDYIYPLGKMHI